MRIFSNFSSFNSSLLILTLILTMILGLNPKNGVVKAGVKVTVNSPVRLSRKWHTALNSMNFVV